MARYAVIEAGVVVNVVEAASPADAPALTLVLAQAGVVKGWLWDGAAFSAPPRWATLAIAKADLARQARIKRIEVEAAGITVGAQAYPIATDIEARQRLRELKDWSDDNLSADIEFELSDGRVLAISRAQFVAVARAVFAHIRGCTATLKTKLAEIDALPTVTDAATYADTQLFADWPT